MNFLKRGDHGKSIGDANREKISAYFKDNPDATKLQASNDLGIRYATVLKHVKKLKGE